MVLTVLVGGGALARSSGALEFVLGDGGVSEAIAAAQAAAETKNKIVVAQVCLFVLCYCRGCRGWRGVRLRGRPALPLVGWFLRSSVLWFGCIHERYWW